MRLQDLSRTLPRFRDPAKILQDPHFFEVPFATPIILINDMHIFVFPLYPYYLKWWGGPEGTLIWKGVLFDIMA